MYQDSLCDEIKKRCHFPSFFGHGRDAIMIDDPNVRQCNDYQIDCSNDQDPSLQLATAEELLNSWNPHDGRSNKSENNLREIARKICTFTASGKNGFTKLCRLGCEKHLFLSFGIWNTER